MFTSINYRMDDLLNDLDDLQPLDDLIGGALEEKFENANFMSGEAQNRDKTAILAFTEREEIVLNSVHPLYMQLDENIVITAIETNSQNTALGTKDGKILFYKNDGNEYITYFSPLQSNQCAISALALSKDSKRLLVGTIRGEVYMYDTGAPKKIIRKLPPNCHAIQTASVKFLSFVSSNSSSICSDSSSIVKCDFTRVLGKN